MRASEIRTMSLTPWARSLAGIGIIPSSGMPGKPLGPQFLSTRTQSASTSRAGSSIRALRSSWFSNTTALPRCLSRRGSAADGLITAPSGQRFPRSTAIPEWALNGSSSRKMTSRLWHPASALFSARLLPVTVRASPSSSPPSHSSLMTAGNPPASWKSCIR